MAEGASEHGARELVDGWSGGGRFGGRSGGVFDGHRAGDDGGGEVVVKRTFSGPQAVRELRTPPVRVVVRPLFRILERTVSHMHHLQFRRG